MARARSLSTGQNARAGIDGHAIAAIAPVVTLLPAWALATAVFWWASSPLHDLPYWYFALVLLLSGVVLFIRPTQRLILGRLFGARSPTREERDKIQRSWLLLAKVNHLRPSHFIFAVIDADDPNAFACGGHLVVVSSYAVNELSQDELTGVLAHELAHHLGLHTVALTFGQWLSLPVIVLARFGFALRGFADAAVNSFGSGSPALRLFGRAVSGVLSAVSWVFLADLLLAQTISNVIGKGAEFKADSTAVEMGFGKELVQALRHVIAQGLGERPTTWRDRIVTAHPPARTRVARIEAQLRAIDHARRRR